MCISAEFNDLIWGSENRVNFYFRGPGNHPFPKIETDIKATH